MTPRLVTLDDLDAVPCPDDAQTGEPMDDARAEPGHHWPELVPLDAKAKPPVFPLDALPTVLRDYVEAVAAATLTPVCWGGMLALAAAATVAQEHYAVQPLDAMRPEPLGLGVGIVSPPGTRKSSVFRWYSEPIGQIEADRARVWTEHREAAGTDPFDKPRPRMLFDDAGPEYIAEAIGLHGQAAVWSAEGAALANACGRYHKGKGRAPIETYLQAMAGDRIIVDRCGKDGRHVNVSDPALTLVATMQPSVLAGIVGDDELRGRGLIARIVWVVADHGLGHRPIGAPVPCVPANIAADYASAIVRLATTPLDKGEGRTVIAFDERARRRFYAMMKQREPKLDDEAGGELVSIVDWAAKLEGLFGRIAALLALVEGHVIVDNLDAARAACIIAWATEHAQIALGGTEDTRVIRARAVWRWIAAKGRPSFTKRDAFNAMRGRADFKVVETLDAPLRDLVERGYIREADTDKPVGAGRPPSPCYEVRPLERHPQNPHNRHSADSADAT